MLKQFSNDVPNVRFIDFASRVTAPDGYVKETDTADGVHLSAAAYTTLRDLLMPHVKSTANKNKAGRGW